MKSYTAYANHKDKDPSNNFKCASFTADILSRKYPFEQASSKKKNVKQKTFCCWTFIIRLIRLTFFPQTLPTIFLYLCHNSSWKVASPPTPTWNSTRRADPKIKRACPIKYARISLVENFPASFFSTCKRKTKYGSLIIRKNCPLNDGICRTWNELGQKSASFTPH